METGLAGLVTLEEYQVADPSACGCGNLFLSGVTVAGAGRETLLSLVSS